MTRRERGTLLGIGGALLALTVAVNFTGAGPGLRHLYAGPVAVAAWRFGLAGGALAGVGVLIVDGPYVLAQVERDGLTRAAAERLVTFVLLLAGGTLAGRLVDRARARRRWYDTLLAVQRRVSDGGGLPEALDGVRDCIARCLRRGPAGADLAVALVVRDADGVAVAGPAIAAGSLAEVVLTAGTARFVADSGEGDRPRRVFAAPLGAGPSAPGVLVVECAGELPPDERDALTAFGVHLGLVLQNARLAWRQERFTEELEAKVAAATRHLAEVDAAKSRFLAVTSHELRTPLTALLGFAELLAERTFPAAEVHRLAAIVRRETERLARIVDDLLDLTRMERGLLPVLRRERVDVGAALAAVVDVFARGRGSHRFEVECQEPGLWLDADPDAVDRVLTNLVSNAVKYSRAGSIILLRARRSSHAGYVEIAVEDEGAGMTDEVLARIFEPYYRAPDAAPVARGSGLGLAVVKSLVEAHGGAIEAVSVPQMGTRIAVLLPALP